MKGIIYIATNKINNKVYIGQTINTLARRKNGHIGAAQRKEDNLYFHRAIRKYGEESFEWKILEEINIDSKSELKQYLDNQEIYYIKLYNSNKNEYGYNLTQGGDSYSEQVQDYWNSEKSNEHRKELKERMSEYWSNEDNRKKHQKWMNNYYQTEEGIEQAKRHSNFMKNYYNGENARINKAKTSKWFVRAISSDGKELIFISSKEPDIYFNFDVCLRNKINSVGDKWIPTKRSKLFGWQFEAIEKDDRYLN